MARALAPGKGFEPLRAKGPPADWPILIHEGGLEAGALPLCHPGTDNSKERDIL